MQELFVSLDIETFGPIPGANPMVELGAACFNIDGEIIDTYNSKLSTDTWFSDPETMKWWRQPENFSAYERLLTDARNPKEVMSQFSRWLHQLPGKLTPIAYPAAFDYMFIYWYLVYYTGGSKPLSFSCLDIKTYVMAALKRKSFRNTVKSKFPKKWFHPHFKHIHTALDDAVEQGWVFIQAHRENLELPLLANEIVK